MNKICTGLGNKFALFIQWSAGGITGFIIAFSYGWKLTLVVLATSPVMVLSLSLMAKVWNLLDITI